MLARVYGMDAYGLDLLGLNELGGRATEVQVHLKTYDLTHRSWRFDPPGGTEVSRPRLRDGLPRFGGDLPSGSSRSRVEAPRRRSSTRRSPRARARSLAAMKGVNFVSIRSIEGLRRRKQPTALEWYCVRALVVIEVEGKTRGLQSTEDRFVLVRARSFKDAEGRLDPHWRNILGRTSTQTAKRSGGSSRRSSTCMQPASPNSIPPEQRCIRSCRRDA